MVKKVKVGDTVGKIQNQIKTLEAELKKIKSMPVFSSSSKGEIYIADMADEHIRNSLRKYYGDELECMNPELLDLLLAYGNRGYTSKDLL